MYLITMEIELEVNICQARCRNFFSVVCDFVSMKAKTYVSYLFRVFFPSFFQNSNVFSCPSLMSHIVTQDFRICHCSLFALQSLPSSLSPLSTCAFQILDLRKEGRLSHCLCRKLLLRSCPFSWCALLSKLKKKVKFWLGREVYLILFSAAPQSGGKSSQGGGTHILNIL